MRDGFLTHKDKSADSNYFPIYDAIFHARLNPYESCAYLTIARLIHPDRKPVTISAIAEGIQCSLRIAGKCVKSLQRRGIVESIPMSDGRRTFRLVEPSEWKAQARQFLTSTKAPVVREGKRNVSAGLRFHVLKRDGFRCRYCGITAAETKLVIDHVHPFSKGGKCVAENLAAACDECNSGKSDSIL